MENRVRYINEHKVCELTGLSLSTLRNDRCMGRGFPYVKIGRSVRYLESDIIAHMEAHKIIPRSHLQSAEGGEA